MFILPCKIGSPFSHEDKRPWSPSPPPFSRKLSWAALPFPLHSPSLDPSSQTKPTMSTVSFLQFAAEQRLELPILATTETCSGGTYVITGANQGLGLECAKHLARLDAKKVILAVRNIAAGEAAKVDIETTTHCAPDVVEVWSLDLADYSSVKAFARKASSDLERIDALVENAGVALDQWGSAEGHESSMTVNVYSTLLLAVLMMPKMEQSAKRWGITPHIEIVTSEVGFMIAREEMEKIQDEPLRKADDEGLADMTKR